MRHGLNAVAAPFRGAPEPAASDSNGRFTMHNDLIQVRRPRVARPAVSFALAAACAVTMAGCASSSKHTSAAAGSNTSATASPTPSTALSKAAFITQADAICTKIDAQLSALPNPAGEQDYPAMAANLEGSVALFKSYISQVQPLADQTADAAELNSKWLTLEKEDFAKAEPLVTKMIAALKAKDAAQIKAIGDQLDAQPDRSKEYAAELTSYGLTSCAKLEDDSTNA